MYRRTITSYFRENTHEHTRTLTQMQNDNVICRPQIHHVHIHLIVVLTMLNTFSANVFSPNIELVYVYVLECIHLSVVCFCMKIEWMFSLYFSLFSLSMARSLFHTLSLVHFSVLFFFFASFMLIAMKNVYMKNSHNCASAMPLKIVLDMYISIIVTSNT